MFGVNILSQFVSDQARLMAWLQETQPRSVVVMDNPWKATEIRTLLPQSTVIHRSYDPHEHEWHNVISPADWLTRYAPHSQGGNVLQALNEPQGYGDLEPLVAWCVELMIRAAQQNIRLCLPHFGVGHPKEDFGTELDPLLRAFDRYPQHILGMHEYAQQSTKTERPYRIGRFVSILKRADALGLRRPQVVITEYGRDVGGGVNDGWIGAGLSEDAYFQFLVDAEDIYREYNVTTCIYCVGIGGGGMWRSFNIEHAGTLLDKLSVWNRSNPMATNPPLDYGTRQPAGTITLVNATHVNIRSAPNTSSTVLGQFAGNEVVPFWDTPQNNWWQVEVSGRMAYVSDTYINITAAPVDPHPPVFLPELEFDLNGQISKAELAAWLRAVGDVIEFGVLENVA